MKGLERSYGKRYSQKLPSYGTVNDLMELFIKLYFSKIPNGFIKQSHLNVNPEMTITYFNDCITQVYFKDYKNNKEAPTWRQVFEYLFPQDRIPSRCISELTIVVKHKVFKDFYLTYEMVSEEEREEMWNYFTTWSVYPGTISLDGKDQKLWVHKRRLPTSPKELHVLTKSVLGWNTES